MRNLKRALSLGLTAAMISGLMVMGSSAASYADVTSEDNVEAIEVLESVGIMIGDENGNFNPDQNVTRNEMAVVMSNLMEYNVASYKNTSPFTDVPSWAEPYVAACYTNGITSGYSDTIYGGSDTVTTAQAALMLMKALGYFQYSSDFGSDWQLATTRQGNAIDLFNGVDSGVTAPMTRNDVAQLVLNTLEAGTVTASTDGSWSIGDIVINNNVTYNYVTSNADYAGAIHKVHSTSNTSDADRYVVELGEQLYQGDLRLREGTNDDFGRPARTWLYENSEIGTYADDPDATYTAKVEAGDIYKDLGLGKNVDKDDVTVYVDGLEDEDLSLAIRKSSDDKVGLSGNGVLTEVYYDEDNNTALVVQVNTYVATVVRTVDATDDRDAYVIISPESPLSGPAPISSNEEFETDQDFEDDAYVLYTYSKAVDEVKSVELAEQVTGTVTRAENDNTNIADAKALTIDGTRYKDSVNVAGEKLGDISVDEEYTIYLDSYGYMIYVEENDEIGDYALLYDVADRGSFVGKKAELVFTDGTMKVVDTDENYTQVENLKLDMKQSDFYDGGELKTPVIVTYRVDEDGVYSLRAVDTDKASYTDNSSVLTLTNDKAGIKVNDFGLNESDSITVNANSATVFVVADPGSDEDFTAYVGIKNAPSITTVGGSGDANTADVYYYCKSGKMTTAMFILPGANVEVEDDSNNTLYLANESVSNLIHDRDGDYYEFQAVVNNEIQTVKIDENVTVDHASISNAKQLNGIFKSYSTDKYGVVTNLNTFDGKGVSLSGDRLQPAETYTGNSDAKEYVSQAGLDKVSKEYTILVGKNGDEYEYTITVDEDANIYYVDEDGNVSESSYNAISIDNNDKVYAVVSDYMVQTLVIEEVATPANVYNATVTVDGDSYVVGDKVTVNGLSANMERGDDMIFTVEAEDGITVTNVKVNGRTVAANDNGEYVVENVTRDQVIDITTAGAAVIPADVAVNVYGTAVIRFEEGMTVVGSESLTLVDGKSYVLTVDFGTKEGAKVYYGTEELKVIGDNTYAFVAEDGVDLTVIDGAETSDVVVAEDSDALNTALSTADTIVLGDAQYTIDAPITSDVTIIGNGETELNLGKVWGQECGILANAEVTLDISGVVFTGNNYEDGNMGAVIGTYAADADAAKTSGATINITDCTFKNFNAGIYINAGEGKIRNNTFENCGDAISIDQLSGELTISNNTFAGNETNVSANPAVEDLLNCDVSVDWWNV